MINLTKLKTLCLLASQEVRDCCGLSEGLQIILPALIYHLTFKAGRACGSLKMNGIMVGSPELTLVEGKEAHKN